MSTLRTWTLRTAAVALAMGAGACVCVPEDSAAAQRGYATFGEYLSCASLDDFDANGAADCYDAGDVDFPDTGVLWARTIWSVSSPDDDDYEIPDDYEPPT